MHIRSSWPNIITSSSSPIFLFFCLHLYPSPVFTSPSIFIWHVFYIHYHPLISYPSLPCLLDATHSHVIRQTDRQMYVCMYVCELVAEIHMTENMHCFTLLLWLLHLIYFSAPPIFLQIAPFPFLYSCIKSCRVCPHFHSPFTWWRGLHFLG